MAGNRLRLPFQIVRAPGPKYSAQFVAPHGLDGYVGIDASFEVGAETDSQRRQAALHLRLLPLAHPGIDQHLRPNLGHQLFQRFVDDGDCTTTLKHLRDIGN